ncbi:MAG: DUF2254 domain-containing protein [Caldimonas sp.]
MNAWLQKHWERLHSSFWFLPSLMAAAAGVLALAAVALDRIATDRWLQGLGWVYSGGAEGASLVLSTIAGSMITIAGVVFSMTLVSLSLASSQLGPRLLRNFMRDTANQVVIGTFVATFVYCLLVLRTIRRADETAFVPHLAVTFGVLLALVGLAVLIYFIHHVAVSIQADEVIGRVARELFDGIERLFPAQIGHAGDRASPPSPITEAPPGFDGEAVDVRAAEDGYLQLIDARGLMALAVEAEIRIRLHIRPGNYIIKDQTLATVTPAGRVDDAVSERLNGALVLGNQRTSAQDVEFAILQLVEIAVRALSPGINDPFTAVTCIDRLGSALCRLARRDLPSAWREDHAGVIRVIAPKISFADIVGTALNQIRQHARNDVAVTLRLLEAIEVVAASARTAQDRSVLRRHAQMILEGAGDAFAAAHDRRDLEQRHESCLRALRGPDAA